MIRKEESRGERFERDPNVDDYGGFEVARKDYLLLLTWRQTPRVAALVAKLRIALRKAGGA
jgi:hypothetical protein